MVNMTTDTQKNFEKNHPFITDALTGVLKNDYDEKAIKEERASTKK